MSKVAKQDWAERKARACLYANHLSHDDLGWMVAKLLRAERARAVQVCRKQSYPHAAGQTRCVEEAEYDCGYRQACDDCCEAINGKP